MGSRITFPPEIIENILINCDYDTLQSARIVSKDWEKIVDYIISVRFKDELTLELYDQIRYKWNGTFEQNEMYNNWNSWQKIDDRISFEEKLFQDNERHDRNEAITAFSIAGKYVAMAYKDSVVEVCDSDAVLLKRFVNDAQNDEIEDLHLIGEGGEGPFLLVVLSDCAYIVDVLGDFRTNRDFSYENGFSAYRKHFCGIKNGVLKIARITNDRPSTNMSYIIDVSMPIDSNQNSCVCSALSDTKCMILVDDKLKVVHYKETDPLQQVIDLTSLQFAVNYETIMGRFRTWIFHNRIIVLLYWASRTDDQIMEIHLVNDGTVAGTVKAIKVIWPYDVYYEEVNYVWLHANTLLLCFISGAVFFYEISDWNCLDLHVYSKRIDLPVIQTIHAVDVVESKGKRTFYIAGSKCVYTIGGRSK